MNYGRLKHIFRQLKLEKPKEDLTAHVIFTEDSFDESYPLLSRTYTFSSDNKAFWSKLGGYSIFASCLDGTDQRVRLDWYMADEGNKNGWKVQECYILEQMRDAAAIPNCTRTVQDDGSVSYFFGNTCIRAHEIKDNGMMNLIPISGDQVACGEWSELSIDRVYGYTTLLSRQLNKEAHFV